MSPTPERTVGAVLSTSAPAHGGSQRRAPDPQPVDYREFAPAHWPDVMALVDEQWCSGELRAWIRSGEGWDGYVQYRTVPG